MSMFPGRDDRGMSRYVQFAYSWSSDPANVFTTVGKSFRELRILACKSQVVFQVQLEGIRTRTPESHETLTRQVEAFIRDAFFGYFHFNLPEPTFGEVDLTQAAEIAAPTSALTAGHIPGWRTSLPLTRGTDAREVPPRKPPIFKGARRRQDLGATVAKSKHRKSFLVAQAMLCFVAKIAFLGMLPGVGRGLLVDVELHPEDTLARLHQQAESLGIQWSDIEDNPDILNLRGVQLDVHELRDYLLDELGEHYAWIIIDGLYRLFPKGMSENDPVAVTHVLNVLAEIARELDCAIEIVLHAAKGDVANRAIEDLTSGTGAFGRFVDGQWGLYPHQEPGCMTLRSMARADKTPPDKVIRFDEQKLIFVEAPDLSPKALATSASRATLDEVCGLLTTEWVSKKSFVTDARAKLGAGEKSVLALLEAGVRDGRIEHQKSRGPHPAMVRLAAKAKAA
jgi:hypothetical protein